MGAAIPPEPPWYETFFGEDYLDIYRDSFPEEHTAAQVDGIVSLLDLPAGAKILDLACGHGRHAIPLAKRGLDVTGFDLSEVFLDRARAEADAQGVSVHWIQGDMRELPFEDEFDAVINIFTAFGYFEDPEDDVRTLKRVRRALKPDGRFLLEILHRDGLVGRFEREGAHKTTKGDIVFHQRDWDLVNNVLKDEMTLIRPDGSRSSYTTAVRIPSLHEFLRLFRDAGLEPVAWYGGLDGTPLGLSSHRLAILSRRR
jgi:SAM-dependent methyltransferase